MSTSTKTSETLLLQKFGFDNKNDNTRTFTTIMNRLKSHNGAIDYIREVVIYMQFISIGFLSSYGGILKECGPLKFLYTWFAGCINMFYFLDSVTPNMVLLLASLAYLVIWFVLYLYFSLHYTSTHTFSRGLVRFLGFWGFQILHVLTPDISTCCAFFLLKLFKDSVNVNPAFTFVAIITILLLVYIDLWLIRMHQSTPDLDVFNKLAYWPQEILCPYFSIATRALLPILILIMSEYDFNWICAIFNILFGVGGIVLHIIRDYNIFPKGKVIICLEYAILIIGGILSIVFHFVKGNGLFYILAAVIAFVITLVVFDKVEQKHERGYVDILYHQFDQIAEEIKTPAQCSKCIRVGVLYSVPIVLNQSFLKWAITRFQNDQKLYLLIAYVYFIEQSPYNQILELVSIAIDVEPFHEYDGLIFYQIFNRLPTQEKRLAKEVESIKRLYDLPKNSLRSFWEAVLSLQWEECHIRLTQLNADLKQLHENFDHVIFENPASELVMEEFIKFATEIEGNYASAALAERELAVRRAIKAENEQNAQDAKNAKNKNNGNASINNSINSKNFDKEIEKSQGSNINLSRLSSVRSSVFMSEGSNFVGKSTDRVQYAINQAIDCRPVFSPTSIFFKCLILLILGLASLLVVFILIYQKVHRLNQQVKLSGLYFEMDTALTQISVQSLKFLTNGLPDTKTLNGELFDFKESSTQLDDYSMTFSTLFADAFAVSGAVPDSFLRYWVETKVNATLLLPDIDKNHIETREVTIIEACRIFQVRSRNLAYIPEDTLGNISDPNDEVVQMVYLYNAVAMACSSMILNIQHIIQSEKGVTSRLVYIIIACILGVDFVLFIVFIIHSYFIVRKEINFFLSLFASMPIKQLNNILKKENIIHVDEITNEEIIEKPNTFSINEAHMSPSRYYCMPIALLSFWCLILIPIPIIWILLGFSTHINAALFVVRSLHQSTKLIGCFGSVAMYAFRTCSMFLQFNDFIEMRSNNELMFRYYLNLFFGYQYKVIEIDKTEYQDSLVGKYADAILKVRTDEIIDKNNCSTVSLDGIDPKCMPFHDAIFYLYNHVNRLMDFVEIQGAQTNPEIVENCSTYTPENPENCNTGLGTNWWRHFYRFVEASLDYGLPSFYELFQLITKEQEDQMKLFLYLGIFLGIFFFIFMNAFVFHYCFTKLKYNLKSMLRPILLMGSEPIMESPIIVKFLQGDYDTASRISSSITDAKKLKVQEGNIPLLNYIIEGVLVCSADGIIIASNKNYHLMMGNTAEDVLGLNVRSVLPDTLNPIFEEMDIIANGGVLEQTITLEAIFFTEDAKKVNTRVSLVVKLDEGETGNKQTTCGLIISDRSDLINSQTQLLQEKKTIEQLLDTIIPHNIAVSLLNGNRDISFQVEKALVLFSDIVSFTPMSGSMMPKEVMRMLNALFTQFDSELSNFKRVTKLKTIGDAYVCAAGIFEGDGPLDEAAKEIVTFATHMQIIIPKLNKEKGYKIHMRIGVDAGGPLICGVLGKEKPLFEVIGQTVNIAEELEASSLHDKVHISEATAELLEGKGFKMEPRNPPVHVVGLPDGATTYTIIQ